MRVITWNCRRASASHLLWDYLSELNPDVALLQEVGAIPRSIEAAYRVRSAVPRTKGGKDQRFKSVLLVKTDIGEIVSLSSPHDWVREQLEYFAGNILAFQVADGSARVITVVAVYSPAWPVNRAAYAGRDTADVKLTQNPDVWVLDLITASLRNHDRTGPWIVAGDFNSCETFDKWKGGPRGNREWLDRMASLGFTECLRHHRGCLTPTFRGPGKESPNCQIDHVFVNEPLRLRLLECGTGDAEKALKLSDHLPIIADFRPASPT